MTNLEKIQKSNTIELEELWCNTIMDTIAEKNNLSMCDDICPFSNTCKIGHNGFKEWLNKDAQNWW